MDVRIGHGYDVHRLAENRKLILGGVEIPYEKGLLGHSDADVLLHSVMDALLGALALGDIGQHFPDRDPTYSGANSARLTEQVVGGQRRRYDSGASPQIVPLYSENAGEDRANLRHPHRPGQRQGNHRGRSWIHRGKTGNRRPRGLSADPGLARNETGTVADWRQPRINRQDPSNKCPNTLPCFCTSRLEFHAESFFFCLPTLSYGKTHFWFPAFSRRRTGNPSVFQGLPISCRLYAPRCRDSFRKTFFRLPINRSGAFSGLPRG